MSASEQSASGKPRIFQSVHVAFKDALNAIRAMPSLFLFACVIVFPLVAVQTLLEADQQQGNTVMSHALLNMLISNLIFVLLAPLAIAVQRFVLLDEVTPHYELSLLNARWGYFVIAGVVINLMWMIPLLMLMPLTADMSRISAALEAGQANAVTSPQGTSVMLFVLGMFLLLIVSVVAVRLSILFPSIAVDEPGASWQRAMARSKGCFWRIFWMFVVAGLYLFCIVIVPVMIIMTLGVMMFSSDGILNFMESGSLPATSMIAAIDCLLYGVSACIASALTSRLYARLI